MEPIPETSQAIGEFGAILFDRDLLAEITSMGRRVKDVVPECQGLSLATREHGVTFTLVASPGIAAALDDLQYLDDGPDDAPGDGARPFEFGDRDVLDEETWQLFGHGTAATGIASTLTLPIMVDGAVAGSVNLYARTPDAFTGKHDQVANILGAWPAGAVTNADLGFSTHRAAQEAPQLLFERARLQVAVGLLVSSHGIPASLARERLKEAARRAAVSETAIALLIIEQATGPRAAPGDQRRDGHE